MCNIDRAARPPRSAATALPAIAVLSCAVLAACGGSSGGGADDKAGPGRAAHASARAPYWVSDAGLRPDLVHWLGNGAESGPIVSLSASEQAQALAAVLRPSAARAQQREPATAVAVQRRTVTGLSSTVYHTPTGSSELPDDLTGADIEAIAPAAAGGFELIAPSALRNDGTYAITGVPEGGYWLRFGVNYVWTASAFIDWSSEAFGRTDVRAATQPTPFAIDAGNLSPWQAGDGLSWVVPMQGVSLAIPLDSTAVGNPPLPLDAALAGFALDLGSLDFSFGLLDAAKGDQAYLNQLVTQPSTGARVLARSLVLPSLSTADGSSTAVSSGFLEVPLSATLDLTWDRSAYAAYVDAVHPGAVPSLSVMAVSAFAMPPIYGTPSDAYTLAEFDTLGVDDIDFGRLRYGNPFPADWHSVLDGIFAFSVRYLAPGATVPEVLQRGLSSSELIDTASGSDATARLTPRITPARTPTINGKPLFQNQLAVGTSPVLAWAPPAVGTPNQYFVRLIELSADGLRTRLRTVGRFYTTETTLTVPPGPMQPGHLYVVTIAALSSGSPVTQPFRSALPLSFATLMSAIVSP